MRTQIAIENFPAELRERIQADVEARGSNRNSVMCEILAGIYKVANSSGSGRKATATKKKATVMLRPSSPELDRAIDDAAWKNRRSRQAEIVAVLTAHYELDLVAAA